MKRIHPAGLGSLVLFAALTLPDIASAYVRTLTRDRHTMHWDRSSIALQVFTGDPPSSLTSEQVLEMAQAAASAWSRDSNACTSLVLRVEARPEAEGPIDQRDGRNNIVFRRRGWDCSTPDQLDGEEPCYAGSALAITSVTARRRDGRIVDTDIEINADRLVERAGSTTTERRPLWVDAISTPGQSRSEDLQNALTHELGHVIGLDHNCYGGTGPWPVDETGAMVAACDRAPPSVREATMFASAGPNDVSKRTLAADDVKAVCDIFPSDPSSAPVFEAAAPDGYGCSVGRGAGAGLGRLPVLALGALGLSAGWIFRRRRRRPRSR
jgi:hypothetical protein